MPNLQELLVLCACICLWCCSRRVFWRWGGLSSLTEKVVLLRWWTLYLYIRFWPPCHPFHPLQPWSWEEFDLFSATLALSLLPLCIAIPLTTLSCNKVKPKKGNYVHDALKNQEKKSRTNLLLFSVILCSVICMHQFNASYWLLLAQNFKQFANQQSWCSLVEALCVTLGHKEDWVSVSIILTFTGPYGTQEGTKLQIFH